MQLRFLCIPEIQRQTAPLVLVDGITGDAEVTVFPQNFLGTLLSSVLIPPLKHDWCGLKRGVVLMISNLPGELHQRDMREMGWGLGKKPCRMLIFI